MEFLIDALINASAVVAGVFLLLLVFAPSLHGSPSGPEFEEVDYDKIRPVE